MYMSKQNNPNINKVFIFADSCGLCGENKFQDIIDIVRKFNKTAEVRTVSLYNGWKQEAKALTNKFGIEVPFIFDFNNQKVISLEEARQDSSKLENILK